MSRIVVRPWERERAVAMNRQQLAHILRAACEITQDRDVLVLGSQSILGTFDEDDLPATATMSMEADVAFTNDPDRHKADQVEAAIGEMSSFHELNGVYAEGVHVDVATLPQGWRDRLVQWELASSHPARPLFLDPHDLAIAKLARLEEKDRLFVDALLSVGLLDATTLVARADLLEDPGVSDRIKIWLGHYVGRHGLS